MEFLSKAERIITESLRVDEGNPYYRSRLAFCFSNKGVIWLNKDESFIAKELFMTNVKICEDLYYKYPKEEEYKEQLEFGFSES